MSIRSVVRIMLTLSVIIINIGCDQVSKKMVRENISPYAMIHYFNDHITITRVENTGAFLSAGDSLSKNSKHIFLALVPIIVLTLGLVYVFSKSDISNYLLIGLCFVIGGGIGNLFDRVLYGSVTDFLYIKFGIFQTGIFNIADVSITTGVFLILASIALKKFSSKKV